MKLIIIAAIGKNNELGKDNNLIWHIKEDLQYFKNVTTNHNILMGKNTFLSLGRLLPNRHHIIISTTFNSNLDVEIFRSIDDFLKKYKDVSEDVYVIGGASIYKEFIELSDEMHLTEIDKEFDADCFFPKFDRDDYDSEIISSFNEPYNYKHVLYKKKQH